MSLLLFLLAGIVGGMVFSIYSLFSKRLPLGFLFVCDILVSSLSFSLFALPFFFLFGGVFSLYQPLFFLLGLALYFYIKNIMLKVLTKKQS